MTGRTYRDFDLEIQGDGQGGYRARVLDSPAGQIAPVTFTLPFSEDKLENYLLKMGRRSGPTVRGEDAPEAATAREFGAALFDAVFKDNQVGAALTSSLDQTEAEDGVGLRLRLRLSDCPELADLPWEYLRRDWEFLALSEWTPVVRFLELPGRIKPVLVTPPLRVLVHISAPTDQEEVDAEGEWDRIRQAMEPLRTRGRLTLDRVANGTWQDLQKKLRQAETPGLGGGYHVFHFIGHGGFSNSTGEGTLAFERASDRRTHRVSSRELGQLLGDRRSLRLAVLNACEGARSTRTDPFAGLAQGLLRAGIPAVIAHQFPISDSAALDFSQSLYEAIADGYPVDAAVAAARMAVWGEPNPIEWATPVLYLRAPDGRIFDIPETPAHPEATTADPDQASSTDSGGVESDPQWNDALEAYFTKQWAEARDLLTGILARHPNDARVSDKLSHAQQQADLAQWYAQAQHTAAAGEWERAAAALNHVVAADPGYRDAATLLEQARQQQRRAGLINDLRRLHTAGKWQAVLAAGTELADLDPDTADPDGMISHARKALADLKVANLYTQGLRELENGDQATALTTFTRILQERPDYRNTPTILATLTHQQAADQQTETTHEHKAVNDHRASEHADEATQQPSTRLASATFVADPRAIHVGQWVLAVAFSPDGTLLATGSRRRVRVWDLRTGYLAWEKKTGGLIDDVPAVAFSPDGTLLATGSWDKSARIWDAATGQELAQVSHGSAVDAVAFSPDGTRLATGSDDKTARIWDAATGQELAQVSHGSAVDAVAFSPDGTWLATGSDDKTARVWDAATGTELAKFSHGAVVNSVAFSPDGTRLATGSDDKTARIWIIGTGTQEAKVTHEGSVNSVAFSPDGTWLATGSDDKTARVWEIATGTELAKFSHGAAVNTVAFSPDGTRLATGSDDKTVGISDISGPAVQQSLYHRGVFSVAFSPDGTRLATGSFDKSARIWDAATGTELATVSHDSAVRAVAFSPDGTLLATGSVDKTARIWDAATGSQLRVFSHIQTSHSVAFSPDGARLATGSADNRARIWDAATGSQLVQVDHRARVLSVAFSPDGTWLATGSADNRARIWDAATGTELVQVDHRARVLSVAFSPDGTRLATGSADKTARIWDAATGSQLLTFSHDAVVFAVAFSPDGTRLATGSADKTARIWDAATGSQLWAFRDDVVFAVAFSPDGTRLATGSADNMARIWDPATRSLLAIMCQ